MHSRSGAMSISPLGIINACNPRRAAAAMRPQARVEDVVSAASGYLHKTSSKEMLRN